MVRVAAERGRWEREKADLGREQQSLADQLRAAQFQVREFGRP